MRLTRRFLALKAHQLLLISILVGAIFASFEGSATFAQITPEEPVLIGDGGGGGGGTGGGKGDCKDTDIDGTRCQAIWCYYTIADGPYRATCKYWRLSGSGTCPVGISCKP